MRIVVLICTLFLVAACGRDESLTNFLPAGSEWQLRQMNRIDVSERFVVRFKKRGKFTIQAPCNRGSGKLTVPYPWFETSDIAITRKACQALETEGRMLTQFRNMSLAEVFSNVLLLTNDQGSSMTFQRIK